MREVGRARSQSNAVIYGTTRTFLEKFGLKDISELPPLAEFAPDPDTEHAIRDRLSSGEAPMVESDEDEVLEHDHEPEDLEMID